MPKPSTSTPPATPAVATGVSTTVAKHPLNPQRGDVYWVNIPKRHAVGHEQYKRRPFLIVSNNSIHYLDMVIGVPLSFQTHKANRQFRIRILASEIILDPGSTLDPGERIALSEQVRALSVERLEPTRQAKVSDNAVYSVEAGLAFVMDIH